MPTYTLSRYPQTIQTEAGESVSLNPMTSGDVENLVDFFLRIPEEERFFLKENVTSREVVQGWATHLDYDRALPLLAKDAGRIVGDAVLIRHRGNARSHTAEIRVTIDPAWSNSGLGIAMIRELADIAYDSDLEFVIFELADCAQIQAIEQAKVLGAFEAGRIEGAAQDSDGHHRDIIFLKLLLGKSWEWSRV
jgi:L-amino acid N-acyltransferase YncA